VHLLFTLLKRVLGSTYHGGIGRHLPAYLDEFIYRFNRKSLSLARNALGASPAPWRRNPSRTG
jgi:hypothetical protein